ncbi:hypothetical protein, partial [Streptomyces sp. NPDC006552]|uniref:hypothetical protein n=1 Tax=Streptomyces sp. NPDC006552 TaxID=3157179 RepID=UPI0033ABF157
MRPVPGCDQPRRQPHPCTNRDRGGARGLDPGPTGKETNRVSVLQKNMRAGEGKILRKQHRI